MNEAEIVAGEVSQIMDNLTGWIFLYLGIIFFILLIIYLIFERRQTTKTMNQSIRQKAMEYQPKTAKNITELKSVDVNLAIQEEGGTDDQGKEYSYNFIEVDGQKYRIPDSVLNNLKAILDKKPGLKTFAVTKTGEGRNTKYTVIPLD